MERSRRHLLDEAITRSILDTFRDVHRALGFGYREYIYALAMERDLVAKGHQVDREVAVMVYYRGEPLARQTFDMIVDQRVIVENKATETLHPTAATQPSVTSPTTRGRPCSAFRHEEIPSRLRKPFQTPIRLSPSSSATNCRGSPVSARPNPVCARIKIVKAVHRRTLQTIRTAPQYAPPSFDPLSMRQPQ
jgi:GxxExxY protein